MTEETQTNTENANATDQGATAVAEKSATTEESKPSERADRRSGGSRGRGRGRGGNRRKREPKEFEESILKIDRVTRVTRGGRQMRFRVTVAIGDRKGRVGFGIGKSEEIIGSIQKAVSMAKKNLITVPMQDGTIPHEVKEKFKASYVHLMPAQEGKGVIAGGAVRKILDLAGVKNVLSKIHGSRNKITCAYCTFAALRSLELNENLNKDGKQANEAKADKPKDAKEIIKAMKDEKGETSEEVKEKAAPKAKAAKKAAPKAEKADKKVKKEEK